MSSENEFADDENSLFEDNLSQRGSLFHAQRCDRHSSSTSQCSFIPHIRFQLNNIKHSSVDCNGVVSLVDGNALPSSPPMGPPLPKVTLDMASTGDNVRNISLVKMILIHLYMKIVLTTFQIPKNILLIDLFVHCSYLVKCWKDIQLEVCIWSSLLKIMTVYCNFPSEVWI